MMISKIVLVMLVVVAIGSCFEMDSNDHVGSGCTSTPVDLVLLIDRSASIVEEDYNNLKVVKDFVKKYLTYYDISEHGTHVTIIQYSTKPKIIVKFGEYDMRRINNTIDKIDAAGDTYIDLALLKARDVYTTEFGMRDSSVKKVLVLFTDGVQSHYSSLDWAVKGNATKLKNRKKALIYTVGVGSKQLSTLEKRQQTTLLEAVASGNEYTFMADSFSKLSKIAEDIVDKQCPLPTTTAPPTTKPIPSPAPIIVPCPFDVALIIDSSNSINNDGWTDIVSFATRIVNAFTFGPKDSRLALIRYNTHSKVMMKFDTFKGAQLTNQNIKHRLEQDLNEKYTYGVGEKYPLEQGLTFIDRAFEMADKEVFTEQAGMRNGVKKICILMTDGMQTNYKAPYTPPHLAARPLKIKGVEIFSVGMGGDIGVEEMVKTASSPDNCYSDETFYELERKAKEMGKTTCKV